MGRGKRIVCLIVFTLTISLRLVFSSKERESAFGTLPPVKVEIPFSVELLGDDTPVTDFRVYMEPSVESPNATLPEPYYLDIRSESRREDRSFGKMLFYGPGRYFYKIKQEQKNYEGFHYDSTVYDLEIEVLEADMDAKGNAVSPYLYAIVHGKKEGENKETEYFTFINSYKATKTEKSLALSEKGLPPSNQLSAPHTKKREVLGAERGMVGKLQGVIPKALRLARKMATSDESSMMLYALATFFTTGSLLLWLYKVKKHKEEMKEELKKEKED